MADFQTQFYNVQPKSVNQFTAEDLANQGNRLQNLLAQEQVNNAPLRSDMLRLQLQGAQLGNQAQTQKLGVLQQFMGSLGANPTAPTAPAAPASSAADIQAHQAQLQSLQAVNTPQDALKWANDGLSSGLFTPQQYQAGVQRIQQASTDPNAFAQWKQQAIAGGTQSLAQRQQAAPVAGIPPAMQSKLASMSQDQIGLGVLAGVIPKEFADLWIESKFGRAIQPGYKQNLDGTADYLPDPTKGITLGPNGSVQAMPGAASTQAALAGATAGATTSAQEAAKAPYTFVPTYANGVQGQTTVAQILQGAQPSAAAAFQGSGPLAGASPSTRASILADMLKTGTRQGSLALAQPDGTIAQSTFDRTQPATGAAPTGVFNPTGPSASEKAAQDAAAAAQKDAATAAVKLQTQPEIESQTAQAKGAADNAAKYQSELNNEVAEQYKLVARNQALLPLLEKFPTGGFGAEQRSRIGNEIANTQSLPADLRAKLGEWVAGGDPATGRVIANSLAAAGISNLLQVLPPGDKPNRAEFIKLNEAAEGLPSGKTTLEGVFAQQKRAYKISYDEQQALTQAIKTGAFNPRTWQGDYSATRDASLTAPPAATPTTAAHPTDIQSLLQKYGGK